MKIPILPWKFCFQYLLNKVWPRVELKGEANNGSGSHELKEIPCVWDSYASIDEKYTSEGYKLIWWCHPQGEVNSPHQKFENFFF